MRGLKHRIALGLVGLALAFGPQTVWAESVHVTLLQLNDVYQVQPVDRGKNAGLARVATLVNEIRRQNPHVFFVLGGDTISPSVEAKLFRGEQMIAAWNALGLDFATLGNHEFDYGDAVLKQRLQESKFQWLAANVFEGDQPFAGLPGTAIREVGGIKIGFLGVLTPDTLHDSHPGPTVRITDPLSAAGCAYQALKEQGADIVVGITHLPMKEDKRLAHALPFVVIMGGHEHSRMQSFAGSTPIFKVGSDARHLGKIDLFVDTDTRKVTSIDYDLLPVTDEIAEDPQVAAVIRPFEEQMQAKLGQTVGVSTVSLNAVQADNRSRETNLGNLIADAYREATGADVALVNGGSIRTNSLVEAGPLSRAEVMSLAPFENPIVKVKLTGKQLLDVLEHAVGLDAKEAGRFPQISGMRFEYDPDEPSGSRVEKVTVDNRLLDLKQSYTLATNTYLLGGGDGYALLKDAEVLDSPEAAPVEHEVLIRYIEKHSPVSPKVEGRIARDD